MKMLKNDLKDLIDVSPFLACVIIVGMVLGAALFSAGAVTIVVSAFRYPLAAAGWILGVGTLAWVTRAVYRWAKS